MAEATEATPNQWADGPFQLLTTPLASTPVEDHDDFVKAASDMCLVHNAIIRTLNTIYLQAPLVLPVDLPDFIVYSRSWSTFLRLHHQSEETHLFPKIAEATGLTDLMQPNIDQHAEFEADLRIFDEYLLACANNTSEFDGAHVCTLIDTFAPPLTAHLNAEIPTLLALREYKDKLDVSKLSNDEGRNLMGSTSKTDVLASFFMNLDMTYEGGIHAGFPSAPGLIRFLMRWVFTLPKRKLWRFASCDRKGRPKEMWCLKEGYGKVQENKGKEAEERTA